MHFILHCHKLIVTKQISLVYDSGSGSSNHDDDDGVTSDELKELRQGLVKVFNEGFLEKLFAINEVSCYNCYNLPSCSSNLLCHVQPLQL